MIDKRLLFGLNEKYNAAAEIHYTVQNNIFNSWFVYYIYKLETRSIKILNRVEKTCEYAKVMSQIRHAQSQPLIHFFTPRFKSLTILMDDLIGH